MAETVSADPDPPAAKKEEPKKEEAKKEEPKKDDAKKEEAKKPESRRKRRRRTSRHLLLRHQRKRRKSKHRTSHWIFMIGMAISSTMTILTLYTVHKGAAIESVIEPITSMRTSSRVLRATI